MCDGPTDETGEKSASRKMQGESRVSRKSRSASIRIIGLGNELRGDDVVGLLAARRLRERMGDRAEVIEAEMMGIDLIDLMKGAHVVILIDAARSGQSPGIIHRLDASAEPIGVRMAPQSSHVLGISETLELARILGVLPSKVIVYGIEAGNMEAGQALLSPVAAAVDEVVKRVIQECEACHA